MKIKSFYLYLVCGIKIYAITVHLPVCVLIKIEVKTGDSKKAKKSLLKFYFFVALQK